MRVSDKEMAPAVLLNTPTPGPQEVVGSVIKVTIPDRHLNDEAKRTILREAVTRYRNEILSHEERQHLQDRIGRLRRSLRLDNGR